MLQPKRQRWLRPQPKERRFVWNDRTRYKATGGRPYSAMTSDRLNRMVECLWPHGERRDIWMIVDFARDPRIFSILLECRLQYSCLYSGPLPPALEMAAPYLVQLEYDDRKTRRFIQHAWGNSWGVLLRCDASLEKLRRHLREFLVVRDPAGKRMLFRYYDPRVLRIYLPTCLREEMRTIFGPIERFWMEDETAESLLEFEFDQNKLISRTMALAAELVPEGTNGRGDLAHDDDP
jgi:Domain of unknown function (DUF4123)